MGACFSRPPVSQNGMPARRRASSVDDHEVDPERGEEPQARPLDGAGGAERDPGREHPWTRPDRRTVVGFAPLAAGGGEPGVELAPGSLAIEQHEPEPEQGEEHEPVVEQGHSRHHDGVAVDREQQPGDDREDRRREETPRDEAHEEHGEGAGERGARAPPERIAGAEGGHAERDHPLAERRMHDVGRSILEDVRCRRRRSRRWRPRATTTRTRSAAGSRRLSRSTSRRRRSTAGCPRFQNRSTAASSVTRMGPPQYHRVRRRGVESTRPHHASSRVPRGSSTTCSPVASPSARAGSSPAAPAGSSAASDATTARSTRVSTAPDSAPMRPP